MTEETIFLAALEKKDPTERVAYLDAVCAGDADLRRQVEALLRSHDDPDNIVDRPMAAAPTNTDGATESVLPGRSKEKSGPFRGEIGAIQGSFPDKDTNSVQA